MEDQQISYQYVRTRREFGQPIHLSDSPVKVLCSITREMPIQSKYLAQSAAAPLVTTLPSAHASTQDEPSSQDSSGAAQSSDSNSRDSLSGRICPPQIDILSKEVQSTWNPYGCYVKRRMKIVTFDGTRCVNDACVGTAPYESDSKGTLHTNGVWPFKVNNNVASQVESYCRREMKSEAFEASMKTLLRRSKSVVMLNNVMDMHHVEFVNSNIPNHSCASTVRRSLEEREQRLRHSLKEGRSRVSQSVENKSDSQTRVDQTKKGVHVVAWYLSDLVSDAVKRKKEKSRAAIPVKSTTRKSNVVAGNGSQNQHSQSSSYENFRPCGAVQWISPSMFASSGHTSSNSENSVIAVWDVEQVLKPITVLDFPLCATCISPFPSSTDILAAGFMDGSVGLVDFRQSSKRKDGFASSSSNSARQESRFASRLSDLSNLLQRFTDRNSSIVVHPACSSLASNSLSARQKSDLAAGVVPHGDLAMATDLKFVPHFLLMPNEKNSSVDLHRKISGVAYDRNSGRGNGLVFVSTDSAGAIHQWDCRKLSGGPVASLFETTPCIVDSDYHIFDEALDGSFLCLDSIRIPRSEDGAPRLLVGTSTGQLADVNCFGQSRLWRWSSDVLPSKKSSTRSLSSSVWKNMTPASWAPITSVDVLVQQKGLDEAFALTSTGFSSQMWNSGFPYMPVLRTQDSRYRSQDAPWRSFRSAGLPMVQDSETEQMKRPSMVKMLADTIDISSLRDIVTSSAFLHGASCFASVTARGFLQMHEVAGIQPSSLSRLGQSSASMWLPYCSSPLECGSFDKYTSLSSCPSSNGVVAVGKLSGDVVVVRFGDSLSEGTVTSGSLHHSNPVSSLQDWWMKRSSSLWPFVNPSEIGFSSGKGAQRRDGALQSASSSIASSQQSVSSESFLPQLRACQSVMDSVHSMGDASLSESDLECLAQLHDGSSFDIANFISSINASVDEALA